MSDAISKAIVAMDMARSHVGPFHIVVIRELTESIEALQALQQSAEPVVDRDALNDLWACAESGYSIDDLKAKIKFYLDTTPQPAVDADAKREAESLAMSLWSKWYKDESPNFELCDSVAGVITQINNMTTGLVREDVSWGVDWGRSGDRSCVSICKSFPDGSLEIVATEFSPYTTPQPVVPEVRVLSRDEARLALWRAIQEVVVGNPTDDKLILENLYRSGVWLCLLSAGKGVKK